MKQDRKTILVTGGAGFLGSHLCDRLLADGHDVICLDNFFTGTKHNIDHLIGHRRFELMRHDVTFPLYVEVDEIYNLACPASPIHYQHDPVQTTKTSVHGAINMLGLAKRLRIRIFQASTSEVYGDPGVHPQPETYWGNVNPIGTRSCYDEGKRCAETLFFDYHRHILLMPENESFRYFAYTAPLNSFAHHNVSSTPESVRQVYDQAFSVLLASASEDKMRAGQSAMVEGVRRGNILIVDAWYAGAHTEFVKRVYSEAARPPGGR
jgi:dTDP-4-dehydrorhamnose reductase